MKQLFLAALLLLNFNMYGQTVKISYSENPETDTPTQLAMELDQKTYLKAVIQADFSTKKKYALTHYKCQDGIVTKTELPIPLALSSMALKEGADSLVIEVMMQQLQDSVKLAFAIDGKPRSLMIPRNYKIPFPDSDQQTYILMETYLDTPVSIEDEIPLVAITSGICKIIQMGDLRMFGQEFCDLRDKHIHPKDWCTIEGVWNYAFYTISFQ